MKAISKVEIVRLDVESKKSERMIDFVADEKPLYVFLNKAHCVTIFCSPSHLRELAVGHLLTEGIVKSIDEIQEVQVDEKKMVCRVELNPSVNVKARLVQLRPFSRVVLSACGSRSPVQFSARLPKVSSSLRVHAETVLDSVRKLNFDAETFRKTGGVHAAAIYRDSGAVLAFAEDVGRHNAVDKVVGMSAEMRFDSKTCFLASTGRLSGDIVLKAARVNLSIVASLAAALDSGIAVARKTGLTLIGFVRGKRMNIYTFPERIVV